MDAYGWLRSRERLALAPRRRPGPSGGRSHGIDRHDRGARPPIRPVRDGGRRCPRRSLDREGSLRHGRGGRSRRGSAPLGGAAFRSGGGGERAGGAEVGREGLFSFEPGPDRAAMAIADGVRTLLSLPAEERAALAQRGQRVRATRVDAGTAPRGGCSTHHATESGVRRHERAQRSLRGAEVRRASSSSFIPADPPLGLRTVAHRLVAIREPPVDRRKAPSGSTSSRLATETAARSTSPSSVSIASRSRRRRDAVCSSSSSSRSLPSAASVERQSNPSPAARRCTFPARANAGSDGGMSSSTRWPPSDAPVAARSSALICSQFVSTSSAPETSTSPNTCG